MGKWYAITWKWQERHYYNEHNKDWNTFELVFVPTGDSISKHILNEYKQFLAKEEVYTREERGFDGFGCGCCISELVLLTADGQKISGFRPRSIAHLFARED